MADSFDPTQFGAVAVDEPFDPTAHGAVPVQEEQSSILQKTGRAVVDTLKGFLPQSVEDVALAPATMFPGVGQAAKLLSNVAFGREPSEGLSPLQGIPVAQRIPQIIQAEKTPALSQERFTTGAGVLADLGMLAGFKAGLREAPKLADVVEPLIGVKAPATPMEAATEPVPTSTEGVPNAVQPSNAQVEAGQTAQRVETGTEGAIPGASSSDYALREAQGAAESGQIPARQGTEAGAQEAANVVPQGEVAAEHPELERLRNEYKNARDNGNTPGMQRVQYEAADKGIPVEELQQPAPVPAAEAAKLPLGLEEPKSAAVPLGTGEAIRKAVDSYDFKDQHAGVSELADDLEQIPNLPKPLSEALQSYRDAVEEDRTLYGERSGEPEIYGDRLYKLATEHAAPETPSVPKGETSATASSIPKTAEVGAPKEEAPTSPIAEQQPNSIPTPAEHSAFQGEGDKVGIAERYREEQQPGSVIPGVGRTADEARAWGHDFINKGGNPYDVVANKGTKRELWQDVGVVRAEYERLSNEKRTAEAALEANPSDPQLKMAFDNAEETQRQWSKDAQPVLTRAGDALRAASRSYPREISTFSDFTDIVNDHFKGEVELTPEKRAELQKAVKAIKKGNVEATEARSQVTNEAVKKAGGKVMSFDDLRASLNAKMTKLMEDCVL